MTKAEIVDAISKKTGVEREDVLKAVEGFMEEVKASMVNGENIYLRGFGTFELKLRKEKLARNISKGTSVIVPAHNIPHFKPSKEFLYEVAQTK